MKIQICKKFSQANELQRKLTKAFPHDTIIVKSCINQCKLCKKQPAAQIKGKKQKAKSISQLIFKIKEL